MSNDDSLNTLHKQNTPRKVRMLNIFSFHHFAYFFMGIVFLISCLIILNVGPQNHDKMAGLGVGVLGIGLISFSYMTLQIGLDILRNGSIFEAKITSVKKVSDDRVINYYTLTNENYEEVQRDFSTKMDFLKPDDIIHVFFKPEHPTRVIVLEHLLQEKVKG